MKEKFREFYSPDYETLWRTCTFVFDTNVLLDLYRYNAKTKEALFEVMERIGEKKWLPYQVGFEYHDNRLNVIHEIMKKPEIYSITKDIEHIKTTFENITKQYQLTINDNTKLERSISDLEKLSKKYNAKFEDEYKNLKKDDTIQNRLNELFKSKMGDPYTTKQLEELYKEAEERFNKKIPPGYKDDKKGDNKQYSDYIIWRQILDYAKAKNKCIIFVTGDEKEDWWSKYNGEKHCHPTLKKEFYDYTGGNEFHMYTTKRFIDEAREFYKLGYSDDVIEEIKSVKRPITERTFIPNISFDSELKRDEFEIYQILKELIKKHINTPDMISYISRLFDIYLPLSIRRRLNDIIMQYNYSGMFSHTELRRVAKFISLELADSSEHNLESKFRDDEED